MRKVIGALAVAVAWLAAQDVQACEPAHTYTKVIAYDTVTEYAPQ